MYALDRTAAAVRVVHAVAQRQLAVVEQRLDGTGDAAAEAGERVRFASLRAEVAQGAELVSQALRHALAEVLPQAVELLLPGELRDDTAGALEGRLLLGRVGHAVDDLDGRFCLVCGKLYKELF